MATAGVIPLLRISSALCAAWLCAGVTAASGAEVTAGFIKGTYVIEGEARCDKLARLRAGGPANAETVPETLTSTGFHLWEGDCTFLTLDEKTAGRVWVAQMACAESDTETEELDTFDLNPSDQSITVTSEGNITKYVRCDAEKGN